MRNFNLKSIEARAHHRNGVGGECFEVFIVNAKEGRFLAIRLGKQARDAIGAVPCFVVDLDKAHAGDIEFGSNSWRGDVFADELARLAPEEDE